MLPLVLGSCSDRTAEVQIDFEQLRLEGCESMCAMYEECDVDISWTYEYWPEPLGCVDRCVASSPLLDGENGVNQCGSREIIALRCLGALDCDGYAAFEAGEMPLDPDWSAPCVLESLMRTSCSTDNPFDLDETIPVPDWP